ncbi:hypothetical protein JD844_008899 [Phrynosoma platyrhinos]|uniref:START domain-containing protein n=1 Tax=Phrynosoma platyrhinos TaxID=52577 RepID=A0ABQ7TF39_PHRPL|nr:hypothetical protein JD844_008899 [Phrynosoma platyrhinos]
MADFPDVTSLATKLKNTVIQYYNIEESEWRIAKKTKDTMVWRKPSEEFSGYLYKTQGIVEDVTNRIVDHIRPGPYRLHWDSLMTTMEIVDKFEEGLMSCKHVTMFKVSLLGQGVTLSRTVLVSAQLLNESWNMNKEFPLPNPQIACRFFNSSGFLYLPGILNYDPCISLDYGEVRPNFVRGFNHTCGWFCFPLKDNSKHSLLIGFIQTDLRGMLPQSAVDTAMASTLTNFYSDLRKTLKA